MNKLTKTERETFEAIGTAICDAKNAADEMPHVTPDTVVKCPECGATFRVGKALVQTKGEAASRRLFKTEVPLPTSGEDAASPLRNTRKRKGNKNEVED